MNVPKVPSTFRLSRSDQLLLAVLAKRLGLTKTGVLEMMIRVEAQRWGIRIKPEKRS
jgi:hypothetical protein